jgi:hypothetical protein
MQSMQSVPEAFESPDSQCGRIIYGDGLECCRICLLASDPKAQCVQSRSNIVVAELERWDLRSESWEEEAVEP